MASAIISSRLTRLSALLLSLALATSATAEDLTITGPTELKVGYVAKLTVSQTQTYESFEAYQKAQTRWIEKANAAGSFFDSTADTSAVGGKVVVTHKAYFQAQNPGTYHFWFQLGGDGLDAVVVHTITVGDGGPTPNPNPNPQPDPTPDPQPTPNPYPTPDATWQAAVAPVVAVLKASTDPGVTTNAADLAAVYASLGEYSAETTDGLRAEIIYRLQKAGCSKMAGLYRGLGTALDGVAFSQLGNTVRRMDAADKARAKAMFAALAWALYEGGRR
jgi:hypothetical protein